jgi:hypothetical protein
MYNDKTLGYIAGIIDGEGYIGLAKEIYKPTKRHSLNPRIVVGNTNYGLIKWLHKTIPGGFIVECKVVGNRQRAWRWNLCKWELIEEFLTQIYPHLKVKNEQALRLILMSRGNRRDLRRYSAIRTLNKRGKR